MPHRTGNDKTEARPARLVNGAALRALRQAVGIKHCDFARDVLISTGYLANIEAGRKQPDPSVARRCADRLGVPLDAITYPTLQATA